MKQLFMLLLIPLHLYSMDYLQTVEGKKFITKMHNKHGFSIQYLKNLLKQSRHREDVLSRYNGTKKHATDYSWYRYKSKILIPESIELGKKFMKNYAHSLNKAERIYKVDKSIITAFIRVESKFGLFGGEYNIWDVLTTLALNPNRKQHFFKKQLEKVLLLARREQLNVLELKGSFAGAMGCVQQMPSVYLKYGVDLNGDNIKDPNSINDCIGSIAKFLSLNGWQNHRTTTTKIEAVSNSFLNLKSSYKSYYKLDTLKAHKIKVPKEWKNRGAYFIRLKNGNSYDIYLGDSNYRVITKYNASKQYALSIALYAKAMKR